MRAHAKVSTGVPSRFLKLSLQSITEGNEAAYTKDTITHDITFGSSESAQRNRIDDDDECKNADAVNSICGNIKSQVSKEQETVKTEMNSLPMVVKVNTLAELKRLSWHSGLRKANATETSRSENDVENIPQSVQEPSRESSRSSEVPSKRESRLNTPTKLNSESDASRQHRAYRKLIETHGCDPVAVLHELGFSANSEQSSLADRLPIRFLMQPSEAAGIDVLRFIRQSELASFSSELASVNSYLRSLQPSKSSLQRTEVSESTGRDSSSNANGEKRSDLREYSLLSSSKLSIEEAETRASILRRFTNSQTQVGAHNAIRVSQVAPTRVSFDETMMMSASSDQGFATDVSIQSRSRKHSLTVAQLAASLKERDHSENDE